MAQNPFGDIPLFREIQKIVASSSGPVNLELARQAAAAVAREAGGEPPLSPQDAARLLDDVHEAQMLLSGYTRLPVEEPMQATPLTRAEWVEATLRGWGWLFEPLAARFTAELARAGGQEAANPMQAALGQIAPLLLGVQLGALLGQLSIEALGRHDLPIPREGDRHLFFVTSNLDRFARDYGLDRDALSRWLVARESARQLIVESIPWVNRYFKSLLTDIVDALEIDASEVERRLAELQTRGLAELETASLQQALPLVDSARHRSALARLRAFVALFEGYANQATKAVSGQMSASDVRIEEAWARRRSMPSDGEAMLRGLLGLSPDRTLEASGATFCAAITKLKGLGALNRVWDAPDNLPSIDEIRDPFAWIERVLDE